MVDHVLSKEYSIKSKIDITNCFNRQNTENSFANFSTACPNGITNITGDTDGEFAYPSSGTYGINETKCWRIEVPKPYSVIGLYLDS